MTKFYDWNKTLSYDAPLNLIITARGKGKTYGIRKQAIKDYLKDGSRFVEIVRYKAQVSETADGYFNKLESNNEFPGYIFKTQGDKAYISHEPVDEPYTDKQGNECIREGKPKWELLGYFVSLNAQQNAKKKTYAKVKRVIFDEFILEPRSFPSYLPNEYGKLVNLLDTIAREVPGEGTPVRVYMLSNACDIVNPYFREFGVYDQPAAGYKWLMRQTVLMHFDADPTYTAAKRETLVGRLARGHNSGMIENAFENANDDFIAEKPRSARFRFGITHKGRKYGVWYDTHERLFYLNGKIPAGEEWRTYALTREDNKPDYAVARRNESKLKWLVDYFYDGAVRYDTPARREEFLQITSLFGVR